MLLHSFSFSWYWPPFGEAVNRLKKESTCDEVLWVSQLTPVSAVEPALSDICRDDKHTELAETPKNYWMAPLLKTTRVASSCWTDDNLIGFQVAQRSIETENHTAPSNNLPEKIPCAQIFINVSLETCIEEWILEAKTDLICVLCHNFWTNFDLDLFSTSKWPSELQFCEIYLWRWRKIG